ncbi:MULTISPECIES: SLC13 family permease [Providencia]|uniref:Anion permease n=1 Tax=Providencia rettgeri TaxID=587 RepID=A0A427HDD1_PRORE|nr:MULTISPECIES: SLC13 family permease [Providencia]ELR5070614.1 anion permease [Providencia rettgeri]ELR5072363.1 anion permease [Providencia rettgeri]ELR5218451.1 anion permease [Providencia rettgeri]ELR5219872.1 anion permease [Providencia rettgeri]ELR5223731.1 anion permease [Providencia rettgeri]
MAEIEWLSAVVIAITIGFWATGKLPEYLVALLFLAAAACLHLAPTNVIFSGFTSEAFWLVLSGFILGFAINKVGLAERIAQHISGRFTKSWLTLIIGVVILAYGLAFIMPSNMGRIALLMPIVMAISDKVGLESGSRGRIGLALAVGFGTFQLSATILPANVPNLVMAGAIETTYGIKLSYLNYLFLHMPILGLIKGVLVVLCIYFLFPAKLQPMAEQKKLPSMSRNEKKLGLILAITLIFWITDTTHGISPAWVGLVAACLCLLPKVGFVTNDEFVQAVNIRTCIYVAGILSLATLVSYSNVGMVVGTYLQKLLPLDPNSPFVDFGSLVGLTSGLNFVVTANGVPALYTPLAESLATATGLPLMSVLMIQVIGYSTPLLPYQASPIVVAMGMGKVPLKEGIRLCIVLFILTFFLLVPIDYLWFKLLGVIPS